MRYLWTALTILAGCLLTQGQQNDTFGPLAPGQPLDTVAYYLEGQKGAIQSFEPEQARFPLAEQSEVHWIVENVSLGPDSFSKLALVFADGHLAFLQAQGGVTDWFNRQPDSLFTSYKDYYFQDQSGLVVRPKSDTAWKLDAAGMHLNLFAWEHPLISGTSYPDYPLSVTIPEYLQMGASLAQLDPLLQAEASFIYRSELDGSDPNAQLQLDCFGIGYGGFSRKAEARFGDGALNTVWILTAKAEEQRLRELLTATYGPPVFVSEDWEAFHNWQVYLRKDKPEILFLTEALGAYYKKEYFGQ